LWPEAEATFFARLEQLYPLSKFARTHSNNETLPTGNPINTETILGLPAKNWSEYWRAQQIYSDYVIDCPTYYQASAFSEYDLPVYKLIFNAGTRLHGATVPFFTTDPSENCDPDLARGMLGYWISFTITLDPNSISYSNIGSAVWPRYTESDRTGLYVLEVNQASSEIRPDPDANAKCDFLYRRSRVVMNYDRTTDAF
jgi:carboxylesterase type B